MADNWESAKEGWESARAKGERDFGKGFIKHLEAYAKSFVDEKASDLKTEALASKKRADGLQDDLDKAKAKHAALVSRLENELIGETSAREEAEKLAKVVKAESSARISVLEKEHKNTKAALERELRDALSWHVGSRNQLGESEKAKSALAAEIEKHRAKVERLQSELSSAKEAAKRASAAQEAAERALLEYSAPKPPAHYQFDFSRDANGWIKGARANAGMVAYDFTFKRSSDGRISGATARKNMKEI